MIKDNKINTKNYIKESSFFKIKNDTFQLKISKKQNVLYKEEDLEFKTIQSNSFLCVRFIVEQVTVYNSQDIANMNKYISAASK